DSLRPPPAQPSPDLIRHYAPSITRDRNPSGQRRHCALRTIAPLADAAGYANRFEGRASEVEIVGVDQPPGVAYFAAQRIGIAPCGAAVVAHAYFRTPGETTIAIAVGRFCKLAEDLPMRLESAMHVPKRAGAAKARELQ